MMKKIKIDRVKSVEEALMMERLGADIICLSLIDDPRYSDNRKVTPGNAISIRNNLTNSQFALELDLKEKVPNVLSFIDKIGVDYVQIAVPYNRNLLPPLELRKELQSRNIGIIYSGIEATFDDDPSWILSTYEEESELNLAFFQVDLLGDIKNAWEYFKQESPNVPDELQILDVIELGWNNPLLVSLDFTVDNVQEVITRIPSIKGISMVLADSTNREDLHFFNYYSALEILSGLSKTHLNP